MAVIVSTDWTGINLISELGFGGYPEDYGSIAETNVDSTFQILDGIGYGGSRAVEPNFPPTDPGGKALARFLRMDSSHGHSGTVEYRIRNSYYNYQYAISNGYSQISRSDVAVPGDDLTGYDEVKFRIHFIGVKDDPVRQIVVTVAVPPNVYANPSGPYGMPPGGVPNGTWWLEYTISLSPPLLATDWVKIRYSFTTSTTIDGVTVNSDGRFCVSVNDVIVLSADNIALGAEWGYTLGGSGGDPSPILRNPNNDWNTVYFNPAGQLDNVYVSSDYEGCGNGGGGGTEPPIPVDVSGIYFINPIKTTKHDSYYSDVERKIPDPTVKMALTGE
jgi:hypothetical protein